MKWIILALVGVSIGCQASLPEPQHATASGIGSPKADLTKYGTFSFAPANPPAAGYEVTPRSLEVQRRLTVLVRASLEKRGYVEAAQGADLLIKISAGSGEVAGDKTHPGNPIDPIATGFIGIDAYDSRTGASVWHGTGQAELKQDQSIDDALLARGVERILADFPAHAQLQTASN